MPVLIPPQSTWENNVYVVTTTRAFILAGVVYLGRSLYYLISRYSGFVTDAAPIAHTSRARIGVDLMNIAADALSMESMDPDVDINVNSGLELGVRQPRRSYQSHHCAYRSRALRHERSQRLEASTISESPTPTAHVCNDPVTVGVNNLRPVEMSRAL